MLPAAVLRNGNDNDSPTKSYFADGPNASVTQTFISSRCPTHYVTDVLLKNSLLLPSVHGISVYGNGWSVYLKSREFASHSRNSLTYMLRYILRKSALVGLHIMVSAGKSQCPTLLPLHTVRAPTIVLVGSLPKRAMTRRAFTIGRNGAVEYHYQRTVLGER